LLKRLSAAVTAATFTSGRTAEAFDDTVELGMIVYFLVYVERLMGLGAIKR
jgi:hypothetical protein